MEHALESWRQELHAAGYSPQTTRARIKVVAMAARLSDVAPSDLQRTHIVSFLARDYATWSRRTYLQHLNAWGDYIGRPEITAGIRRPPVPQAHPDPLREADLQRLMTHLSDRPRSLAWVTLGAFAGLRAAEVAAMHHTNIQAGSLRIVGKGGRTDSLPMSPLLERALRPWAFTEGGLWPVHPVTVSSTISRAAREIGLKMRFHQLRHRFGTAVYRETRDLLLTQQLMRHTNPKTTAGYAAIADDAARRAVGQIPGATPEDPEE